MAATPLDLTRDRLAVAAAELELDLLRWHELPTLARDLLGDGIDSAALVRLSAFEKDDDPVEVEHVFRLVLRELAAPMDADRLACARRLRDEYAQRVVRGELTPHAGASWITWLHSSVSFEFSNERIAGESLGIAGLVGLDCAYWDFDEGDPRRAAIEEAIVRECECLLARAEREKR